MTIAEKILQLKRDIDAVYQAGLSDGGGEAPKRKKLTGKGNDTLNLKVEDNTIYNITNYLKVIINPPNGSYQAHLFIDLPNIEGAIITLNNQTNVSGDRLDDQKPGDSWEISLDSSLGTLLLNTTKIAHE